MLFEANLRVGDIVQITPVSKGNSKSFETIVAKILKINLRTTEIQTREGNVLIIPNTRLTQEQVQGRREMSGDLVVYSGTLKLVTDPSCWWLWPWEIARNGYAMQAFKHYSDEVTFFDT